MQCWQCGVTIRPGQKLCVYCGAKLTQDDGPEYDAPAERGSSARDRAGGERELRRSSSGGSSRGGRASDGDGWSEYSGGSDRSDRSGQRERDDHYRSNREDPGARGESRASRRTGDGSSSRDPLDDPRAPRNLRGSSSSGRSSERSRGGYERQSYDDADYEYDDYNPRDRASPRYQPRFDPDSAEYDAVADQRRQSHLRPRQDDPRGARSSRDGWQRNDYDRDGRYAQERGGSYGGYGAYGEAESAEYAASNDDRAGRRDRGAGPSRGGRGMDAPDQQGYGGGWDQYDNRNAGGYTPGGYNAPAMGGPNAQGAQNWNGGAWAPEADPNSWAPPGAPGAGGYAPTRAPARKRSRGPMAVVISLAVVVVLAGGGFLARGELSALLHRGGSSGTPAPQTFATYTPGPTPTVLSNYKLYNSANSKYIMEYPTAWSIQTDNNPGSTGYDYTDLFQQQSPLAAVGVETAAGFNAASNGDIIQAEVNGVKDGAKQTTLTFTKIGNDVPVNVGGETWTRRDYTVSANTGVTLHLAILATHHSGRGYAIVLYSAASDFVHDDTGVFKTMLATFRFTS